MTSQCVETPLCYGGGVLPLGAPIPWRGTAVGRGARGGRGLAARVRRGRKARWGGKGAREIEEEGPRNRGAGAPSLAPRFA